MYTAIGVGLVLGLVIVVVAFEVANQFELNLFRIRDAA
jgi:hypothetical protein